MKKNSSNQPILSASNELNDVQRILSTISGIALGVKGIIEIKDDSTKGIGFIAAGGILIYRGITGKSLNFQAYPEE